MITDNTALELIDRDGARDGRQGAGDREPPEAGARSRCGKLVEQREAMRIERHPEAAARSRRAARARPTAPAVADSGIMRAHGTRHPRARRFARFSRRSCTISYQAHRRGRRELARAARRACADERPRHQRHERPRHGNGTNGATARTVTRVAATSRCRLTRAMPAFARPGRGDDVADRRAQPVSRRCGRSSTRIAAAATSRANLDPLGLLETARIVELDPATWGFTEADHARRSSRPACTACRARRSPSSSRTCAASTPARSASSSCTSRRRRAAAGSPSAWRRRSPQPLPARCAHAHARAADQRRAVRAVLPHEVSGHEAVLARGQRER